MRLLWQSFQTQASFDRAQETSHRGQALSVQKMPQKILTFWILQSAHQPQVRENFNNLNRHFNDDFLGFPHVNLQMMSWLVTLITPLWTWTDLRASQHRMYLLTTWWHRPWSRLVSALTRHRPWSRGRTGHKLEIRWQSQCCLYTVLGLMPGSLMS